MTQITQEMQKGPKKVCFNQKVKNFHKSKVDGLKKLSYRAYLFYDLLPLGGALLQNLSFLRGLLTEFIF